MTSVPNYEIAVELPRRRSNYCRVKKVERNSAAVYEDVWEILPAMTPNGVISTCCSVGIIMLTSSMVITTLWRWVLAPCSFESCLHAWLFYDQCSAESVIAGRHGASCNPLACGSQLSERLSMISVYFFYGSGGKLSVSSVSHVCYLHIDLSDVAPEMFWPGFVNYLSWRVDLVLGFLSVLEGR